MAKAPNPVIDGKQIQPVVMTDEFGNYLTSGSTASTGVLGYIVQGAVAPSTVASANPIVIGAVDPSSNVQYAQMDTNLDILVGLGTGLNNLDDNVVSTKCSYYLAQITSTFVGGETVLNQTLVSAGLSGPAVFDWQSAIFYVENKAGGTMNSCVINTTDTIGSTTKNVCYVVPSVNVNNNTVGQIIVPWAGMGGMRQVSASFGFVAAASPNGTIKTQGVLIPHQLADQPLNYTIYGNVTGVMTGSWTSVIGAPGASQRLYLQSFSISNINGSTTSRVQLAAGSGGTVMYGVLAAAPGGLQVNSLGPWGMGVPVGTANTGLFMQCGTASANVDVYAICRLGT